METPWNSGIPALGPFYWSVAQVELTGLLYTPLAPEGSVWQRVKNYRRSHCPLQTDTEQCASHAYLQQLRPPQEWARLQSPPGDTAGTW